MEKKLVKWSMVLGMMGGIFLSHQIIQSKFEKPTAPELRILAAAEDFVLEYEITAANQNVILPFHGATNVVVDFNDGSAPLSRTTAGDMNYVYANPGTYQIKITGTLTGFGTQSLQYFYYSQSNARLQSVLQWGDTGITSLSGAFFDADNLTYVPADLPSTVTDLSFLFRNKNANWSGSMANISTWDTGNVTNFQSTFYNAIGFGNTLDITSWDTSSATNMREMFYGASSFNQDISSWDVRFVTTMEAMFERATLFNQPIGSWTTTALTNVTGMFRFNPAFNQPLNSWNVSQVTNFSSMFQGASVFNQDLNLWDTSSATNMSNMFREANMFNGNITTWNVSNVTNLAGMFFLARNFNQNIGNWNVSKVTSMYETFYFADKFNQDLSAWDVGNVTNFSGMFNRATAFNQPLNTWDTSSGQLFASMFIFNTAFNQPLDQWDVSSGTNFSNMFAYSIFNQDISSWNVGSARFMNNMFQSNTAFNQPLNTWNVANVENMERMFSGASSFNQPLDQWNVSKVTNMFGMFESATAFNQDISSWDVSKVTQFGSMFNNADAFNQPIGNWNTSSAVSMAEMFANNGAFNQYIGEWDTAKVTNFGGMFNGSVFNQDIGGWDTSSAQFMYSMFRNNAVFNQDLSGWNTANVQYMYEMFQNAVVFNSPLNTWNTAKVLQTHRMFEGATAFNQPLDTWDMSKNEAMFSMFARATSFNQDLPWTTSALINASEMFSGATAFNGDVSSFDMSKVLFVNNFFQNATSFNQPIPEWSFDVIHASVGFERMFSGASAFNQDISGWTFSRVTNFRWFMNGVSLNPLYYDAFLQAMVDQNIVIELAWGERQVDFGLSKYSKVAKAIKDQLIADYGWTILDGGQLNLTITVDDTEKYFGEDDPDFTVSYTGLVEGAGEDTLENLFVFTRESGEDVGEYTVSVTGGDESYYYVTYETGTFAIVKPTIDLDLISWDYDDAFTYDGTEKSVSLLNVPSTLTVTYTNASATNAGEYTASVTYTYDTENYDVTGSIPSLTWSIEKAEIDITGVTWDYEGDVVYTGQTITVIVVNVPEGLTPTYEGNSAINVGDYTASVTFTYDTVNYHLVGHVLDLEWFIIPAEYDMSNATWDYSQPFTYDMTEKTVTVVGLPDGVSVASYTGNTATNPGTYTASVTLAYDTLNYEEPLLASLTWSIVADTYTITFDSRGGTSVAPISGIFGSNITPPTNPTREGFIFNGWNPSLPETMPMGNVTLSASWLAVEAGDQTSTDLTTIVDLTAYEGEDVSLSLSVDALEAETLDPELLETLQAAYNELVGRGDISILPFDVQLTLLTEAGLVVVETINGELVLSIVLPEGVDASSFSVFVQVGGGAFALVESTYDAATRTVTFSLNQLGSVYITYQNEAGFNLLWLLTLLILPLLWFFFFLIGKKRKKEKEETKKPVLNQVPVASSEDTLSLAPLVLPGFAKKEKKSAQSFGTKGTYLEINEALQSVHRLVTLDGEELLLPTALQPSNAYVFLNQEEVARCQLGGFLVGASLMKKTPGTYVDSAYYVEVDLNHHLVDHVIFAKTRLAPTTKKGHRWVRIKPREIREDA